MRWREARRPAEGIGGAARWHPGAADVRRSRSHGRRLAALQGRVAHCLAACGIYTSAPHHRLRSTTLLSSVFSSPCTTRTRSPLNSHDSLCLLLHHDLDDLLLTAPRSKLCTMKPREYCCCAFPVVYTGIYVALLEQFVLGATAGVISIGTPSSEPFLQSAESLFTDLF